MIYMAQGKSVSTVVSSVELIDSDLEASFITEDISPLENTEPHVTSIRLLYAPHTVSELLWLENYHKVLIRSFVFIQNTKESSDKLIKAMTEIVGEICNFRFFQTHLFKFDNILEEIEKVKDISGKPQVFVIEVTNTEGNIVRFCEKVASISPRSYGIWLQGYIRYLDPRIISLFDALFTFSMAEIEYEILRTAISIPPKIFEEITRFSDTVFEDKVLFFLNYRRSIGGPLLERNPIVLSRIKEESMEITPFIPVLVEAAKFFFNEATQWLEIVRKRISSEKEPSKSNAKLDQLAPFDKQQFSGLEKDPEALKEMFDRSAVELNVYRIKGLVDQLQIHYKNLTDHEKTEAEYGVLVPQHTKRAIERESEAILAKTQELQDLLSLVFQKKLQA
jgi:hypothetical protein